MCGIAGIIYRNSQLHKNLGSNLLNLIQPLETRGPDSCGVGLYGNSIESNQLKIVLLAEGAIEWEEIKQLLGKLFVVASFTAIGNGKLVTLEGKIFNSKELIHHLGACFSQVHLMSYGQFLEIYKQVGSAQSLFENYDLKTFAGSHAIGHTRMATESVVDTYHSHPFAAGEDLCIVHNGQVSNYYKLRFALERKGVVFETHNDSEAIAHYINYHLTQGKSLEAALHSLLNDIDGTYTFLISTSNKVALVRDKFAAKPAVIYESPEMIAIASEYRCFLNLPTFDPSATIREPDAGEINIWSVSNVPIAPAIEVVAEQTKSA